MSPCLRRDMTLEKNSAKDRTTLVCLDFISLIWLAGFPQLFSGSEAEIPAETRTAGPRLFSWVRDILKRIAVWGANNEQALRV